MHKSVLDFLAELVIGPVVYSVRIPLHHLVQIAQLSHFDFIIGLALEAIEALLGLIAQ